MIEYRIICEEELCVANELLWAGSIETGVRTAEAMYKNTKGREVFRSSSSARDKA